MTPNDLQHSLRVLVFDYSEQIRAPLSKVLAEGDVSASLESASLTTFPIALAASCDVVVATYSAVRDVLTLLHRENADIPFIVVLSDETHIDTFSLGDDLISDVIPLSLLQRFPLVLRRERKLREERFALEASHQHAAELENRARERTADLQKAKERVEAILHNSANGIALVDINQGIEQTNASFNRMFGCKPDDYFNESVLKLFSPEDKDTISPAIELVLEGCQGIRIEARACRRDGTVFEAELSIGFISKTGFVCAIRDITEHKRAEAILRASEERYHLIAEVASEGIELVGPDARITYVNPTMKTLLGYEPEEMIGHEYFEFMHPTMQESARERFEERKRGTRGRRDVMLRHKNGFYIWVLVSAAPVVGYDGTFQGTLIMLTDIDERKQAEEALRESEERYRLLAENASDVINKISMDGIRTFSTASCYALLGYTVEELVGTHRSQIIHPDDYPESQARMEDALQTGKSSLLFTHRLRHKEGHYIWVDIKVSIVRDTLTGEPLEIILVIRDISERRHAEAALRESEERFRQLAENFDQALFMHRIGDHQLIYVNPAYEALIGKSRQEIYDNPRTFLELVHPEDQAVVHHHMGPNESIEESALDFEYRIVVSERDLRWVRVRTFPIKNSEEEIVLNVGIIEDITNRKQAEIALQESEGKYRHLIETMRGGLAIFDKEYYIAYLNDRFCELLGYTSDEMIGKTLSDFADETNRVHMISQLQQRRQGENVSYEIVAQHKSGWPVYLLMSGSPLFDKDGNYNGSVIVATDITIQKQAEDALRQALAREKELGELKSRFVSMASHEFRTPLATILATTETLSAYRHKLSDEKIEDKLNKIRDQIDHLKDIMDDVLLLARMQARRVEFNPVKTDLHALCMSVLEEFRSRAEVKHQLYYLSEGPRRDVMIDPKLMRQVISNLITNGIKYSPEASSIEMKLIYHMTTVSLQVRDEGIGIPEADMPHLFQPFHRASNVGTISGTGLGLVIVREVVELHKGTVTVESWLGKGALFAVHIPV